MALKIITTEDGSHSLFDEELNETYHSTRGAKGESMHVFIKEGVEYFLSKNTSKKLHILEIGLGTGLNVFLTVKFAEKNQREIIFTSLEPFPISKEVYEKLNYHKEEEKDLFLKIHESDWEGEIVLSPWLILEKTISRLEHFKPSKLYNVIYFDAFAPSKQPEVWSMENLRKCFGFLENGGILTSYCAQGRFKRNLKEVGFEVETLQGAMGKKEMVRARKK